MGGSGHATLLMYRLLFDRYLLAVFRAGRVHHLLVSFADLLDLVPVGAASLTSRCALPLHASVWQTLRAWTREAYVALTLHATRRTRFA